MDAIITLMKIKWKSQIFMHLVLVYNNFKIYSVAPKQYLQSVVFTALDRFLSFRDWNFIIIIFSSTGLVNLEMPPMPVPYGATNQVIRCTTKEDLKIYPQWSIINSKGQYDITTGTVSTVYTSSRTNSIVNLSNVTELWNGMYECSIILLLVLLIIKDDTMMAKQKKCTFNTHDQKQTEWKESKSAGFNPTCVCFLGQFSCIYHQTGNCTTSGCTVNMLHKASAQLDVALLPDIDVFTEPSFPRCKTENDILQAKAKCEISNSTEPYNVTWDGGLKGQLETQSK